MSIDQIARRAAFRRLEDAAFEIEIATKLIREGCATEHFARVIAGSERARKSLKGAEQTITRGLRRAKQRRDRRLK